jgi:hypothetical protein
VRLVLLLASAARRLLGIAMAFLSALPNHESHYPRAQGAPLRRVSSRRYANHSATDVAFIAVEDASRGSEPTVMRRDTLESRADRGMRAYVTSGAR